MTKTNKETEKENGRRKAALQKKYTHRITIAKQGREAFQQKDYIAATKKYNEYLGILAELNDVDDVYKLSPAMFDNKKEVTEMLLISHVYWEISRINEMTPKLQKTYAKALSQFVKFTVNQPYQVFNAEMLRKYIKKNKNVSAQINLLNDAYQQIFVQSKKCYIATMCFTETHQTTQILRDFKQVILKYKYGRHFVANYYSVSSRLVSFCQTRPYLKNSINFFTRPLLTLLAKTLQQFILK